MGAGDDSARMQLVNPISKLYTRYTTLLVMAYEVPHEDLLRAKKFNIAHCITSKIKEEKKKKLFLHNYLSDTLDPELEAISMTIFKRGFPF